MSAPIYSSVLVDSDRAKLLLTPESSPTIGANLNGPTLVRVPDWVRGPLGRYYLYFAHHQGDHIRMAYGDRPDGPFTVYEGGVLAMENSPFLKHIASPEVWLDEEVRTFRMIYHGAGLTAPAVGKGGQASAYAESEDGLHFTSRSEYLAEPYIRVFRYGDWWYSFSGGPDREFGRAREPWERFEFGPVLRIPGEPCFDRAQIDTLPRSTTGVRRLRHVCFEHRGDELDLYYTMVGDYPERIKRTTLLLGPDWEQWRASPPVEVYRPTHSWEGAEAELFASTGGAVHRPVCELRDPFLYREGNAAWLYYSVAGEHGIGVVPLLVR